MYVSSRMNVPPENKCFEQEEILTGVSIWIATVYILGFHSLTNHTICFVWCGVKLRSRVNSSIMYVIVIVNFLFPKTKHPTFCKILYKPPCIRTGEAYLTFYFGTKRPLSMFLKKSQLFLASALRPSHILCCKHVRRCFSVPELLQDVESSFLLYFKRHNTWRKKTPIDYVHLAYWENDEELIWSYRCKYTSLSYQMRSKFDSIYAIGKTGP